MTASPLGFVMLDANALDRSARDGLVDRFMALVAAGVIAVLVGRGVQDDCSKIPQKDRELLLTPLAVLPPPTHDQKLARLRVRAILRGDSRPDKHEADAAHVSEASERGCAFFVTHRQAVLRR